MSDMALDIIPRKITVTEYHRMAEAGIIRDDERLELLDGMLVPMSPIGAKHWVMHALIVDYLIGVLGDRALVAGNASLELGAHNEPQPDVLIVPRKAAAYMYGPKPRHDELYALIEVADSSLRKDLGFKRELYRQYAILDYFVVDLKRDVLLRFSTESDGGYSFPVQLRAGDRFSLQALPDIELAAERFLPPPDPALESPATP